ncbi:stage II sporulation protein M [Candidatus Woesearchaeota archaeon]|nr:stage II sporulation protein M [Candidatus Woesearchaeota archaeon]
MVFESLLSPKSAERYPWVTLLLGFICSSIAIFLGNYIFPNHASLAIVALTTLFFVPLFYLTMIYEEQKDVSTEKGERGLLKEHSKAISFFIFLFIGMMFAFMLWYMIFSSFPGMGVNSESIFQVQSDTIRSINGKAIDNKVSITLDYAVNIFENNIKVMIFCILFSFVFGAGAIFIITWNASVIGLAAGKYAMTIIGATTGSIAVAVMQGTGCALTRYLTHGIPEILAYFIAGLAGGIISVALVKHNFGTKEFEKIMIDATTLILISIGVVFIATIIEVFVTPLFICRL